MASAAILAGGRARRFGGRAKSALMVAGQSILDRQLQELRQLTDDILLVGGAVIEAPAGVRLIADRVADGGPLAGLDAALATARDDRLLVVACDMPFVTAPFLASLLRLSDLADAVVPRTDRGYHPLCAVYTRACHQAVLRHLADRRLKMVDLIEDLRVHVVEREALAPYGGERLLANVNTPDELRGLQALLGHEL